MVSQERLKEVIDHLKTHGQNKTMEILNISHSSLERYVRLARREGIHANGVSPAKILLFDIETAPMTSYIWSLWSNHVPPNQVKTDWYILTWSAKWLFSPDVFSERLNEQEASDKDDTRLVEALWGVLNEADIVIAHNGRRFDVPKANTRFLLQGLQPPLPYRIIDTLDVLKKQFSFSSNKLDYVNKSLGMEGKIKTDFDLWERCFNGDVDALADMDTYCRKDVMELEELYLKIRPWIKPHPNISMYADATEPMCPTCGHTELNYDGYYCTNVGRYRAFRCEGCGAIGRLRVNTLGAEKKQSLTRPIAR